MALYHRWRYTIFSILCFRSSRSRNCLIFSYRVRRFPPLCTKPVAYLGLAWCMGGGGGGGAEVPNGWGPWGQPYGPVGSRGIMASIRTRPYGGGGGHTGFFFLIGPRHSQPRMSCKSCKRWWLGGGMPPPPPIMLFRSFVGTFGNLSVP